MTDDNSISQSSGPESGSRLVELDYGQFCESLTRPQPANDLSAELRALWYSKKGDWNSAHKIVQDLTRTDAAWVHAYLHRIEGDLTNARYWYSRAGKPFCNRSLADEWRELVEALL